MKSIVRRWLPAIAMTSTRKAALGLAAAAVAGAALVGVSSGMSQAEATPTVAHLSAVSTPLAVAKAGAAAPAPAAPAKPVAPVAPAPAKAAAPAPAPAKEKALGYQFQLQPNYYYCGPAATRIALSALGQLASFDDLATQLGTTTNGTNSAFDVARVLNARLGRTVYTAHSIPGQSASPAEVNQLKADVVTAISGNRAVVANIIGTTTDMLGGTHAYGGGHYLTVVGYGDNGNTVKIADPADPQGDGSYWMSTVDLANWAASRGYAS